MDNICKLIYYIDMPQKAPLDPPVSHFKPEAPGDATAHLAFLFESISQKHPVGLSLYSVARSLATGGPFLEDPLAFHGNPVCEKVKSNKAHHGVCLTQKNLKIARAFETQKPFLYVCPFGVQDWVVPIPEKNPLFVLFITHTGAPPRSHPLHGLTTKALPAAKQFLKWNNPTISHIVFLVTSLLHSQSDRYTAPPQGRLPDVKAQLARHAVRYRYRFDISLHSVARELEIDKTQLARAYKKCWGSSFQQDLIRERLKHAKAQLYCGTSVTEVAHEVGFRDPGYLHRLFRRTYGVGPAAWQRGHLRAG